MSADHKANAETLDIALYGKPDIYTPPEEFMPRRASIAAKLAELYPARDAVDLKAETERLIKFAQDSGSVSAATAAVATATLALVEQQRIANLFRSLDLVFSDEVLPETPWGGGGSIDLDKRGDRTAATVALIREGLGMS